MTGFEQRVGAAATADGSDPTPRPRAVTTIIGAGRERHPAVLPAALHLQAIDEAGETFRIVVVAQDGREMMVLGPFGDEDAIAIWRSIGAASGLPLVIVGRDGRLHMAYDQIGPVLLGPVRMRRRFSPLSLRRPRFLIRRKSARLPRRPLVYREPELAGQDGR